jgi:ABC-2 type transport system permease protein
MTIRSIITKEFAQIRRDRRMVFIMFAAPVLQLVLFGYAVNLDVRDIPTAVCDLDRSPDARKILAAFTNSGYFTVKARVERLEEIDKLIDNGRAVLAIVLPRGFGADLRAGRQGVLQIVVDGTESRSALIGLNYAAMIIGRQSQKLLLETIVRRLPAGAFEPGLIDPAIRVWYNPELRSRTFMVPGVLALILLMMTMMLTSMAVVREKEMGTLEQLIVTPIRPWQLILGKLLPFVLVGLADVSLILGIATFWFRVPLRGSVLLLYGLSLVFMLSTLGLGLLISTVSQNQQQAMMTSAFAMMPMFLLSGFAFPIENMPRLIQAVTYAIPLRYFFVVIRGIFLKGVGIGALWDEALAMLGLGTALLALSVVRFRKKIE